MSLELQLTAAGRTAMGRLFVARLLCSSLCLIGASKLAGAETIVRYECNVIGTIDQEPIGDEEKHQLVSFQYSCFGVDGLLKGAVYTASNISEWDGSRGIFLMAGGIHRAPGGLAVTQSIEGTGSVVVRDGKIVGNESLGKVVFKLASGTLSGVSGKTFNFNSKSTGPNRFSLEIAEW
jgi:hypothetical protein